MPLLVLTVRMSKLYYTASGTITPIGGRPVHRTATYRSDDTRECIIQFCPPDDAQVAVPCTD
jgi:predicted choloylglycine hydrolase